MTIIPLLGTGFTFSLEFFYCCKGMSLKLNYLHLNMIPATKTGGNSRYLAISLPTKWKIHNSI